MAYQENLFPYVRTVFLVQKFSDVLKISAEFIMIMKDSLQFPKKTTEITMEAKPEI